MTQEKNVFRVTFERVEGEEDGNVQVEATGGPNFLISAMSEVLAAICAYAGADAESVMKSPLGDKVKEITKKMAYKAAMSSVLGSDDEVEEHVLEITPEMEKEAAEEEARNEQD